MTPSRTAPESPRRNSEALPAVFLDRDGTINVDHGYLSAPEQFEFLPGAVEGMRMMRSAGFVLIVVSNQSGIGRGYYTEENYRAVTERMFRELDRMGIELKDCLYCPHSPESGCACRKPGTGMIRKAVSKWRIDVPASYLVGDKASDIRAGLKSGLKTLLISDRPRDFGQHHTVPDLTEAARIIWKEKGS
jgi:D,D-heptose 1,7-bisphosphate phosphatase